MAREAQPYIYDPPPHLPPDPFGAGTFNPKAVSQRASLPPPPPRPKPEGPLLDVNRHPDSYLVVPQRAQNLPNVGPHAKSRIQRARRVQLALRVLALLAAVGLLVCVACLKGVSDTQGWILRLPPAVDITITLYALYHLARAPTRRPPGSAASYHLFALVMDVCLIAFYVFTALLARSNAIAAEGAPGRWRSLFTAPGATDTLLTASWIIAISSAGLHLFAAGISIYLLIKFRQINRLPPDMNPLEDNLTARPKHLKHAYKNSNASTSSSTIPIIHIKDVKRWSALTASSAVSSVSTRSYDRPPLIPTQNDFHTHQPQSRPVSFFGTRADPGNATFNPHNPSTARHRLSQQPQPGSGASPPKRNSNTPKRGSTLSQEIPPPSPTPDRMSPIPSLPRITKRASATASPPTSPLKHSSAGASDAANWFVLATSPPPNSMSENYEAYPSDDDELTAAAPHAAPASDDEYDDEPQVPQQAAGLTARAKAFLSAPPQPLRMHPPTPPPPTPSPGVEGYDAVPVSSPGASVEAAAPKPRFYGDLAAAMRGVRRGAGAVGEAERLQSMKGSVHGEVTQGLGRAGARRERKERRERMGVKGGKTEEMESVSGTVVVRRGAGGRSPVPEWTGGADGVGSEREREGMLERERVVSRSGVDVASTGGWFGRRDVSGKVAEEGRGGLWRRVSGAVR
ncbi:hypothetical protein EJ06DRAFT_581243 [Trichodelitschia bisporula]|uniref:Uncharacterized protein n=1 Tax=Trichodelitschia bisporula TaxID=703511 RepID=A0A6G1I1X0_9PEZI|nr:hypothetical protein EJ06DRAFT_581243 [Trichodelitschia bisporula]